jgi:hypothetical protein
MGNCGDKPKRLAIGIAPLGIVSIGIVPMGVVSIGVVPMGVLSLGVVGMGVLNACVVGMGVAVAGLHTTRQGPNAPGSTGQLLEQSGRPQQSPRDGLQRSPRHGQPLDALLRASEPREEFVALTTDGSNASQLKICFRFASRTFIPRKPVAHRPTSARPAAAPPHARGDHPGSARRASGH